MALLTGTSTELDRLRLAGLRPTRQRVALARLLLGPGARPRPRHVTAEALHIEAARAGIKVSLATIYNTLHQFTGAGFLREVVVDSGPSYFDTNLGEHHHLYFEDTGELRDVDAANVRVTGLPAAPRGTEVARVDVVVRLRHRNG